MRWVSLALALLSGFLTMLAVGAGIFGVMPARGGEGILHFAGLCLDVAVLVAAASTAIAVVDVTRARPSRPTASIVACVLGGFALVVSSGILAAVWLIGKGSARAEEKSAALKVVHEKALTEGEVARARDVDGLIGEWSRDHDASDAAHRGQVVRLSFPAAGSDWVDGAYCVYALSHGDVVCCLASGNTLQPGSTSRVVARYAGTDRRYATPGRDQGKLVLDSCEAR